MTLDALLRLGLAVGRPHEVALGIVVRPATSAGLQREKQGDCSDGA